MIKTLIVTDYMGTLGMEPEEEAALIALQFMAHGISLDWVHSVYVAKHKEVNPDLIIIDYGGILPGSSTDVIQIRELCEWLENHPGKLGLIWTSHTTMIYNFELAGDFEHLDNLIFMEPIDAIGIRIYPTFSKEYEDYENSVYDRIKAYFGDTDGQT